MVQKDVAERLVASPGTPAYGSLSVAVQYAMERRARIYACARGRSSRRQRCNRASCDSCAARSPPFAPRDLPLFWKVVRGAFAYRRKTLVNSLSLALDFDRAKIARALQSCNFSPELRGERLDLGDFARLADALAEG